MRIVLKSIPPSLNEFAGRKNVNKYRREKDRWTQAVRLKVLAEGAPAKPYKHAAVRIDYYFPSRVRRDPDNYCGKMLLDGLTKGKVIADDSFFCISLSLHGHVDRENPRTEITVLEIPEEVARCEKELVDGCDG